MNTINELIRVLEEMSIMCFVSNAELKEADTKKRKEIAKTYLTKANDLEAKLKSLELNEKDSQHIGLLRDAFRNLSKFYSNISKGRTVLAYQNGLMMQKKVADYSKKKGIGKGG